MCGIVAYYSTQKNSADLDLLVRLVLQAKIRGLHAFGVGTFYRGSLIIKRFFELWDCINYVNQAFKESKGILIHCRYSTSGDWEELENNQPVVLGNDCLIFNGVISMKTKEEMEQEYDVELHSDNDGELFLHNLQDVTGFVSGMRGSFAGVWIQDGIMRLMRNARRPLWYLDTGTAAFVFSTYDIIRRAGGKALADKAVSCDADVLYELGEL